MACISAPSAAHGAGFAVSASCDRVHGGAELSVLVLLAGIAKPSCKCAHGVLSTGEHRLTLTTILREFLTQ